MIRVPTMIAAAYDWHSRAMMGEKLPVHESWPQCGWYVRQLIFERGAPLFPARIYLQQETGDDGELLGDETFRCTVGDKSRDPYEEWQYLARRPIFEIEYIELMRHLKVSDIYYGPRRPFVRWFDPKEIATDWLQYKHIKEIYHAPA